VGLEAGGQLKFARQMAWRWRDLSVGLYVPFLEFNRYVSRLFNPKWLAEKGLTLKLSGLEFLDRL
jgi:hypothetical protein